MTVKRVEKINRLGARKQEQQDKERNKNFVVNENLGNPQFAEVFAEEINHFQNRPSKGYFMEDTRDSQHWEEREMEILAKREIMIGW